MNVSFLTAVLCFLPPLVSLIAQVPQLINYQGRVLVGNMPFTGTGQFKFSLVSGTGAATYWSNDGPTTGGSEPATAVSLGVSSGLYSVLLGDISLANMTPIPPSVFTNSDVRLRVWFNDGVNGSHRLNPDQRLAAVGYAMMAANVQDGTITGSKLADATVTSSKLAVQSVQSANIADGAVLSQHLAAGTSGSIEQVVRGVVNFGGSNYEVTQDFSPSINPMKSHVIVGAPVTGPLIANVGSNRRSLVGASLISLTSSSITIAVDQPPGNEVVWPQRVSYQIIQFK